MHVEPDSGTSVNVMDEYQFRALKHRSKEIGELDPSKDILKTLQSDLVVKGEFHTTIRIKNRGAKVLSDRGKNGLSSSPKQEHTNWTGND